MTSKKTPQNSESTSSPPPPPPRAKSWTFINIAEGDFALANFENGDYLIEEWSLRRFLNVPNTIYNPAFKSLMNEEIMELAKPQRFLTPDPHSQIATGFPPRLLIELCELHLIAWEEELLSLKLQATVEACAVLYWNLVGGGAEQHVRGIFGEDYEHED
jgi:hypothetical protein